MSARRGDAASNTAPPQDNRRRGRFDEEGDEEEDDDFSEGESEEEGAPTPEKQGLRWARAATPQMGSLDAIARAAILANVRNKHGHPHGHDKHNLADDEGDGTRPNGVVRSGLLSHPSIASAAPRWWAVPPAHLAAAAAFDERHVQLSARGERMLRHLPKAKATIEATTSFYASLNAVRWNRFLPPQPIGESTWAEVPALLKRGAPKRESGWRLEESIWAPRAEQCDAKDFYDNERVEQRMFDLDWSRARNANELSRVIVRHDDNATVDADGDGVADEVSEVEQVLWEHHHLIYTAFDFFASLGAKDIFHVDANAWTLLVRACRLADPASTFCTTSRLDQLFVNVDVTAIVNSTRAEARQAAGIPPSGGIGGGIGGGVGRLARQPTAVDPEKYNKRRALNRYEFMQLLVRVAINKYVLPQRIPDVSCALSQFFNADLDVHLEAAAKQDSNAFRRRYCYTAAMDAVLQRHAPSLRVLYEMYAQADAAAAADGLATKKLLSFVEWTRLTKDLRLVSPQFTSRHATLCFVWSRMRVVDEAKASSRARMVHLTFEDFLEALVRVACMKSFPTDRQIEQAGCADAGHFLLQLQCYPSLHAEFVAEHAQHWYSEPRQPACRCVDHLIALIIRTVEGSTEGSNNLILTRGEAKAFMARGAASNKALLDQFETKRSVQLVQTQDAKSSQAGQAVFKGDPTADPAAATTSKPPGAAMMSRPGLRRGWASNNLAADAGQAQALGGPQPAPPAAFRGTPPSPRRGGGAGQAPLV